MMGSPYGKLRPPSTTDTRQRFQADRARDASSADSRHRRTSATSSCCRKGLGEHQRAAQSADYAEQIGSGSRSNSVVRMAREPDER